MRFASRTRATLLALLLGLPLAACGPDGPSERAVYVIDELRILLEPVETDVEGARGEVDGFDIDGFDGPPPEGNVCRGDDQSDFVAPDGRRGIDNSLASGGLANLVGLLSMQNEDSSELFEGLLQGAVTGGTLLVILEIEGINDYENDSSVMLNVYLGQPFDVGVGTDGRLLSGQSFDVRDDVEPVRVRGRIRDGILYADDIELLLSGSILDVTFDVPVRMGHIALDFQNNGTVSGVLGGGLPWQVIADVIPRIGGAEDFALLGARILAGLADVMNFETGECDTMSAAIRIHGVPAFIFEDEGI